MKFAPARRPDNDRAIVHEKLSKICGVLGGAPKRRSRPGWDNRYRPPSNPNRALRGLGMQGPTCGALKADSCERRLKLGFQHFV